jgi:hypothetical protein
MTELVQSPRTRVGEPPSATEGAPTFSARPSPTETPDLRRKAKTTTLAQGDFHSGPFTAAVAPDPSEAPELEQFWEATIEEIRATAIRVHTRDRSGEEADAWLTLDKVPRSEQPHIALGAPMRISVFLQSVEKTRRRFEEIRILRRNQWQAPVEPSTLEHIAEKFLDRMLGVASVKLEE